MTTFLQRSNKFNRFSTESECGKLLNNLNKVVVFYISFPGFTAELLFNGMALSWKSCLTRSQEMMICPTLIHMLGHEFRTDLCRYSFQKPHSFFL